jgi:multidrug efflux pump subunit AcrB
VNPFHGLIRAFLGHRIAANLLAIMLCIGGAVALMRLNTQFFPETTVPNISVSIAWPGASAQDVSEGILDIIEPQLRFVEGVKEVTSYAIEGSSRTVLEFESGADMDKALADVEQRMASISGLPQESEDPRITRFQFFETVAKIMVSGPFDEAVLQGYAKSIRDRLLVEGINRVSISGKRAQEIEILADPAAMRQLRLTAEEIGLRIASINQNQPLGSIDGESAAALRVEGRALTADGIARIEVRSLERGQRVMLSDVAVVREIRNTDEVQLFRNADRAIVLDAERFATSDTLDSMQKVLDVAAEVQKTVPATLKVEVYDVRAKQVAQRISLLVSNAWQGFAFVFIILLLFLNVRVAFWVALGVPVSIMATFAFMLVTGQTLNSIALVGLILVLGMLVDDAIVVAEHAQTKFDAGHSAAVAAEEGATRMFLPVIASTTTTQAAFFPILLISGTIGQIMSAIPLVVIMALLASTLECFLTLPSHLRDAFESIERSRRRRGFFLARLWGYIRHGINTGFDWFRNVPLGWLVSLAYRWRYVTVALAVSTLLISFAMLSSSRVGFTLFPVPEPELVNISVTFAPGQPEMARIAALDAIEASVAGTAKQLSGEGPTIIAHMFRRLGQSGQSRGENLGRIEIELTPGESRDVRTEAFISAARKTLPQIVGVERTSIAGQRGGPPGSDIDVRLSGAPIEDLKQASLDLQDALEGIPGLSGISDDLPFGKPDIILELSPRGRVLGLTTASVAAQVRAAYQGTIAMRFARGDEEVAVRVRQREDGLGAAGLRDLAIRTPAGNAVRLEEVTNFREQRAFSVFQRRNGKTTVAVTANIVPGQAQADQVIAQLRDGPLPQLAQKYGVSFAFEGRAQTQREVFADLNLGAAVALALIFLILAFVFQSWTQPVLVMLIIPFGIIGAIFGHWWMGFSMTLLSLVGLLGLSGVLVNGSIVLVDRMNERVGLGETLENAAVGASVDRFRALFLTTATTVLGMAPLMLDRSLQAQFLIPIAITMTFGLAFATILVLFITPAFIGIWDDLRRIAKALYLLLRGEPPRHFPKSVQPAE